MTVLVVEESIEHDRKRVGLSSHNQQVFFYQLERVGKKGPIVIVEESFARGV